MAHSKEADVRTTPQNAMSSCGLLAQAYLQADPLSLPSIRKQPGLFRGKPLPGSILKNVDDQTILGLAAVLRAIELMPDPNVDLTDWAILGSPRFIARMNLSEQFVKFKAEGAWSASPHSIPHRCLHSTSGTISQALKIHGPNFGNGGGPGGYVETILSAVGLLQAGEAPGAWVVCAGFDPEPYRQVRSENRWQLHALALALISADHPEYAKAPWQLSVHVDSEGHGAIAFAEEDPLPRRLAEWHHRFMQPLSAVSSPMSEPGEGGFQIGVVGGIRLGWQPTKAFQANATSNRSNQAA